MTELLYVPLNECRRIRTLDAGAAVRRQLFATVCRINTLYMIKKAGSGHIGTSFSAMDLMVSLYMNAMIWQDGELQDVYFSSKGHDVPGLYSVLMGLELLDFDMLHRLRRIDGLPGHPDVQTPWMKTNTGSLGMGISKAKGLATANTLAGDQQRQIYVLTGDGELQEGQLWESLPSAVNQGLGAITAIVDHNKIQSDTWVAQVNDLGDLESKFRAFGWHVTRCDGHDIDALDDVFRGLKVVRDRPKVLIADTVKGKGVSFMEQDPQEKWYKFHSGAPDDSTYHAAFTELLGFANKQLSALGARALEYESANIPSVGPSVQKERLVATYSEVLLAQAEANPRIVALDADLVLDCGLIPFQERFPERFIECGIAEQDMVSQAGGLALEDKLPVAHSFACFLSARPNEQIYNNASEHTKVIYVGSLAGVIPGGTGHSHQCVRDISALSGVPNLVLVEPCTGEEVAKIVDYGFNKLKESIYLRLVSLPCSIPFTLPHDYGVEIGTGVVIREGVDAVVVGYGPVLLSEIYHAADHLSQEHDIELRIVNLPWLNRVNVDWLCGVLGDCSRVFTLDNHYIDGGQGDMILRTMAEHSLIGSKKVQRFGVTELPHCGTNEEVLQAHGLDARTLAAEIGRAMTAA